MPFAFLLVAIDLVAPNDAREPAPLVLAWGGRVVPGLSAPLLVDDGKPCLSDLSRPRPVDFNPVNNGWSRDRV